MLTNLGYSNTIASVLANAKDPNGTPYYPSGAGTKEGLQSSFIAEETITISGRSYTLKKISQWDVKVFADELDNKVQRLSPFLWDLFSKYALNCLVAMRLANNEDEQGYGGAQGNGNQIDCSIFNPRMFWDPDSAGNRRTAWDRTISSTGSKSFFIDTTAAAAITMTKYESMIWLAWYNPATNPCADMWQLTYNTNAYDWQDLDFEYINTEFGDAYIEFKQPWILPPNENGMISVYYYRTGTDSMRPVGIYFKESKNMRSMTAPATGQN